MKNKEKALKMFPKARMKGICEDTWVIKKMKPSEKMFSTYLCEKI